MIVKKTILIALLPALILFFSIDAQSTPSQEIESIHDESICASPEKFFNFSITQHNITQIQIIDNCITFYVKEEKNQHTINAMKRCCFNCTSCFHLIHRQDSAHQGKHQNLHELDRIHYHIQHLTCKKVSISQLSYLLNSLSHHFLLPEVDRVNCLAAFKQWLRKRPVP